MAIKHSSANAHKSASHGKSPPMSSGTMLGIGLLAAGGIGVAAILLWPRRAAASSRLPLSPTTPFPTAHLPPPPASATTGGSGTGGSWTANAHGMTTAAQQAQTREIQRALNQIGMPCSSVQEDGYWGRLTDEAIGCAVWLATEAGVAGGQTAQSVLDLLPGNAPLVLSFVRNATVPIRAFMSTHWWNPTANNGRGAIEAVV
ncbi:MAG: hypothetical protein ABI862_07915 [Ilumatobacteraceae bacterium]